MQDYNDNKNKISNESVAGSPSKKSFLLDSEGTLKTGLVFVVMIAVMGIALSITIPIALRIEQNYNAGVQSKEIQYQKDLVRKAEEISKITGTEWPQRW